MTKYDTQGAFDKLGQDPFLPPAPAPRKSRKGWVVAGLLVGAILIGGAVSDSSGDDLGRDAAPVVAETDTSIGEAAGQSVPLAEDAISHFEGGMTAIQAYDVDGSADHMDAAGDDYSTISGIWSGVDETVSDQSAEIANELYAAADDLRAMRIESATAHVETATSLIQDSTTYLGTLG